MTSASPSRLPYGPDGDSVPRLAYGADYNPEQWPREVWEEDVRLMREAGVNIVSVGIFSWARIQPDADTWDFGWLDEIMDLLHEGGIGVDLATATASPPPWLTTAHPEILPVTSTGETVWPGARQHWRPTSPVFRSHALGLVRKMAERYANHPALVAWHISNELGCHNIYDFSDDAAHAFRGWLRARYTRSTPSTTPGAPRSGRSVTATGRRSCRPGWPARTRTPPSNWTSSGSPRTR